MKHLKRLALFIALSLSASAQTTFNISQLTKDPNCQHLTGPVLVMAAPQTSTTSVAGVTETVQSTAVRCISLDLAGFKFDTSGASPVLRLILPTPPTFVYGEVPSGNIDGTNAVFTLASAPNPAAGLRLYRNGIQQTEGIDYTLSGATITFQPGSIPGIGQQGPDGLQAWYSHP